MPIPTNYRPATLSLSTRPAPGATPGLDPTVAAAQKRMYELTEGRSTELKNDPYQKSAMDYLQGVIGGKNVPFSDTAKNAILAQQGAGAAAAEAAQMQALRESLGASGGSIYDPGYQAAQRQAMSQRQGANLDAMGQLDAKAAQANFQAQSQGAQQLSAARNAQNAQINQMNQVAAAQRAQTTAAVPQGTVPGQPAQRPTGMTPWQISQQVSQQNHSVF